MREQGLVVGEHGYGTQPLPWRFPVRNRIIAALADAVVVVEATPPAARGSRRTTPSEYGRDVYALPGSRRNPAAAGCNALIADGAKPLLDPGDLLFALGPGRDRRGRRLGAAPDGPSDRDEQAVLRALGGEPATIDELERRGLAAGRLGTALRALEPGGRLERPAGPVVAALSHGVTDRSRSASSFSFGATCRRLGVELDQCPYDRTPIEAEVLSGGSMLLTCPACAPEWEWHGAWLRRVREPDREKMRDGPRRARSTAPAT